MRATIKDVSAIAQVSTKTVSRVLNKERYVSAETKARVERAVAELNFRPSAAARTLAGKRSFQIALIYDNHSPHYIHQIQTGVWARCIEEGVRLLAQPSDAASPMLADEVGGLIDQTQVDGVILSSPVTDAVAALDELERRNIPYVRISPGTEHGRSSSVSMDDVQAADEMTAHLIALGHRRIGFIIGHTNHTASDLRLFGYRRALDRAGIDFEPKYVRQGAFDFASGEAAADILLDLPQPPTAIFASNDDMALGAMAAIAEAGLSTPEDISVAGFDDSSGGRFSRPQLTTMRQPLVEIATFATRSLIEGEVPVDCDRDVAASHIPASELVIRRSTAPPA